MTHDRESTAGRLRFAALCVGQLVSWGILYYALIVAAPEIAADTTWPLELVTLLFSLGLMVSGIAGIVAGRLLDARGPRIVMTIGSALGAGALVVVATAPNLLVFGLGWVLAGLAQSAVLYQAAFTVITRRYGEKRQVPLTVVTLAGGLASTVFAPTVALLLSAMSWRDAFLLLAALLFVVTVPIHWFTLEHTWVAAPTSPDDGAAPATIRAVLRTRRFWFLELSTVLLVAALYTVTLAAIPLFTEKGMTYELAAVGLGLLGAGQTAGRLLHFVSPKRTTPWVAASVVALVSAGVLALLGLVPGPIWLLIVIGVVAGAVRGIQTLVQASAVSDRWGTANYGSINGVFAAPVTITAALTPALGPLLVTGVGSYAMLAVVMAGVAAVAALFARWS